MKGSFKMFAAVALAGLLFAGAAVANRWETLGHFLGGAKIGRTGTTIEDSYSASAVTLDIANVPAATCLDTALGTDITGAAVGDVCVLGLPAAPTANLSFDCYFSAANTAQIRACNPTAGGINPASGAYSVRSLDP